METEQKDNDTRTNAQSSGLESMHTPGPWQLRIDSEKHYAILDEGGFPRAQVFSAHRSTEKRKAEALANARLIAAAPELLEACKRSMREIANCGDHDLVSFVEVAIAKAEGSAQR